MTRQSTFSTFFAIIALIVLICTAGPAIAFKVVQRPSGYEITSDELFIEITGGTNVPKFTFEGIGDNESPRYKVMFQQLYQSSGVDNFDKLPRSNVALPSLDWTFSDFNQTENTVDFSLETTGNSFGNLRFDIHVNNTGNSFKFDTVFSEVPQSFWISRSRAVVLRYKVNQQQGDDDSSLEDVSLNLLADSDEDTRVRIGDEAYMIVQGNADSPDGEKEVRTQVDSMINIAYERFEDRLTHDPTLGVASKEELDAESGSSEESGEEETSGEEEEDSSDETDDGSGDSSNEESNTSGAAAKAYTMGTVALVAAVIAFAM